MRLLNFLIVLILCVSFSSAISVCIDRTSPSAPSDLSVSGNVGSILLGWSAAVDEPSCSGIAEYVISREGLEIGRVDGNVLSFVDGDNLGAGEYIYTVYAVDLVGQNAGSAIKNVISFSGGGGSSGGSPSGSFICVEDWGCGNWSECVGNEQRRLCSDLNKCGTELYKPETYQECGVESSGVDGMVLESINEEADIFSGITSLFSGITGAVTGTVGTAEGMIVIIFIVLVLIVAIVVIAHKKGFFTQSQ